MVVNRNGTHLRTLLHDTGNGKRRDIEAGGWSWSPDGTQLAGTFADLNSPKQASAIFTVDLDSLDTHRITPWRLNAGNPDYSPSGRRIVFNSAWEGQTHSSLYTISPNGTNLRRLNHPRVQLHVRAQVQPLGQSDRLRRRRAAHDHPPGAPDDRRRRAQADHARHPERHQPVLGCATVGTRLPTARGSATRASRRA